MFVVQYKIHGLQETSPQHSREVCEWIAGIYRKCGEFSDVEVVEAQQALPDIADERWDVQAGDGGDGGYA